jgi:hypothetical protein
MKQTYINPQVGDLIVFKNKRKFNSFYGKTFEIPKDKLLIIVSLIGGSVCLLNGKCLGIWYLNLICEQCEEYTYVLRGGLVNEESDLKNCLFDSDIYLIQRKVMCAT